MDIVTHGMMGVAIAGPWLGSHPAASAGVILGSVIPDLDAFSRCFGKRAFLMWHQGWTHSLPGNTVVAILLWACLNRACPELAPIAVGLLAGAALHALLDLTNTYGVRILWPLTPKRYCWEWLFFIDSVVIVLTTVALGAFAWCRIQNREPWQSVSVGYVIALAGYISLKGLLRWRANGLCDGAVSIIPSAMWPWVFFVCQRHDSRVISQRLNVITGQIATIAEMTIHDAEFRQYVEPIPEFQAMSTLSPAYHIVESRQDGDRVVLQCRDLRIINFGTSFGRLDVILGPQHQVLSMDLHV